MEIPDWAIVLGVLYQQDSDKCISDIGQKHPFVQDTELDIDDASSAVDKLSDWNLVEMTVVEQGDYSPGVGFKNRTYAYQLTEKGFNVAHDRELANRDNRINVVLVIFTLYLVVVNIIDSAPLGELTSLLLFAAILALLILIVRQTNAIDFDILR
jgi:hypothetical protein